MQETINLETKEWTMWAVISFPANWPLSSHISSFPIPDTTDMFISLFSLENGSLLFRLHKGDIV